MLSVAEVPNNVQGGVDSMWQHVASIQRRSHVYAFQELLLGYRRNRNKGYGALHLGGTEDLDLPAWHAVCF